MWLFMKGIILAGGNSNRMRELSQRRAVAALPVAGSFFSIDFALSNMECSRIQKVAVLTQYNSRSLNDHLSSSKWWNFGRKQGGLYQYTPSYTNENNSWYRGTADAMAQNLSFLKEAHEPYVVIASGDCVYKMDYNKVLEYHIDKGADITVVCKDMPEDFNVERYGTIETDEDGRITEFIEKPLVVKYNTISCGIYVIRNSSETKIDVFQLNAKNAMALAMADRFELNARDIVYVDASGLATWNRLISLILPSVQTVYYGMLATHNAYIVKDDIKGK